MKKYFAIILLLSIVNHMLAQTAKFRTPDSLATKDYDYFNSQIIASRHDTVRSLLYSFSWLEKAKKENNPKELAQVYRALIHRTTSREKQLLYADSMVVAALRSSDNTVIGSSYLTRGLLHYDRLENVKALDDYILANAHISKTKDTYLAFKIKYAIAQTRYFLGYYEDAISLLKECVAYFKNENDVAYISSLHALGLCYNRTGKYDLSSQINRLGFQAMQDSEIFEMRPYFVQSEGVNYYFRNEFEKAITLIKESMPALVRNRDISNEAVGNFYIARSYWSLNRQDKAVPYLKKVDHAFSIQNYIRPDLRPNYELLIGYYKKNGDQDAQLFYIDRLFKLDAVLNHNNKYLIGKIVKEYDTKKLRQEKNKIEIEKQLQGIIGSGIIVILLGTIGFLVVRHLRNKERYRRFEELMNNTKDTGGQITLKNGARQGIKNLKPDVAETILANLDSFESSHQYLEKGMTLVKIARRLKTNQKYVSMAIFHYRGKGTIEYISDLKIDYIVEKLKAEKKYRLYTNEALAELTGFGSTQIFAKTFKNRTGMSPTWFINELRKTSGD